MNEDPATPPDLDTGMTEFARRMGEHQRARNNAAAAGKEAFQPPTRSLVVQTSSPLFGEARRSSPVPQTQESGSTGGRFLIYGGGGEVAVSPGCVARYKSSEISEGTVAVDPDYPELSGTPVSTENFVGLANGSWECRWVASEGAGEIVFVENAEDLEEDSFLIARFTMAGGEIENLDQRWASDIYWEDGESSSEESSEESSGESSDEGSEESEESSEGSEESSGPSEDSGESGESGGESDTGSSKDSAVVPYSKSKGGYTRAYTAEWLHVPFFDWKRYHLDRPVTIRAVPAPLLELCEPGTVKVQCTNSLGRHVGGEVIGNKVHLHAGPADGRPEWVDVTFIGDRKGFPAAKVRLPDDDYVTFAENEARLNPRFKPIRRLMEMAMLIRSRRRKK